MYVEFRELGNVFHIALAKALGYAHVEERSPYAVFHRYSEHAIAKQHMRTPNGILYTTISTINMLTEISFAA